MIVITWFTKLQIMLVEWYDAGGPKQLFSLWGVSFHFVSKLERTWSSILQYLL